MSTSRAEKSAVVHLLTLPYGYPCQARDGKRTRKPWEVTCKTCLRSKVFHAYKDGWEAAKSEMFRFVNDLICGLSGLPQP